MKTVSGMNVGDVFGMLTLVSTDGACWRNKYECEFECVCGKVKNIPSNDVKSGKAKSCGCARREVYKKHGLSGAKGYAAWKNMKIKKEIRSDLDFEDFITLWPDALKSGSVMTSIGVLSKEIGGRVYRGGCAVFPFRYYCAFQSGLNGSDCASIKAGVNRDMVNRYTREHPDVYAAGLQARAEREASSKPAPPALPVNTSVDF